MDAATKATTNMAWRRRSADRLIRLVCVLATCISLALLASILATLITRGAPGLHASVFTHVTRSPGSQGGLLNAIVGSVIQTALGILIGGPIGLMVGMWLAEFARQSRLRHVVRFVSDILLSAPSILIGLFVYQIAVRPFSGFSGLAGGMALAIIAIPIVIRTTEDMLLLVPQGLREAAIALGAPRWRVLLAISCRAAREGITTGLLLAIARLAGETAPLLFTSLGNLNWSVRLDRSMASLPVTIYSYAGSAFDDWVQLAWTGALLITLGVLVLNLLARLVLRNARL